MPSSHGELVGFADYVEVEKPRRSCSDLISCSDPRSAPANRPTNTLRTCARNRPDRSATCRSLSSSERHASVWMLYFTGHS